MSAHSTSSPLKTYFVIWATLLVGTYVTYRVAFVDLGSFNAAVALTIATIKATLVALFFMHVWGSSDKMIKVVVISALFFLLLLLSLSMADFSTRAWS
ncbi:MAG: cytochrome C oxidase subunit IV family protein [Candidatus Sulfotelmatobacter sp.]